MGNETRNKFAVGVLQLAVTLALTALGLYLLFAGKMSARQLGLLLMTCLIFGLAIYWTKDKWQYWRYWAALLACLVIHFALLLVLQTYLGQLPTAILGVCGTFECAGTVWVLLTVCE
jgi:uncharacterized membrane protein